MTRPTASLWREPASSSYPLAATPSLGPAVTMHQQIRRISTRPGLAALPLTRLLRSAVVLHGCASDGLVSAASSLLTRAAAGSAPPLLARASLALARSTVFRQFVAGESLDDVHQTAAQLRSAGVRCIVDHSTEESEAAGARAGNLQAKLDVLRLLGRELRGACSFVPVKLTALISPALLERLAAAVEAEPRARSWGMEEAVAAAGLSPTEHAELRVSIDGLRSLCLAGAEAGVGLLLDAEQTHRQPAIHLLARDLMREYNRNGRAVVHDTHQAYLRGAQSRIGDELGRAQREGYTLGVKLVRGAYRSAELARGSGHLLHATKQETDREYDGCASLLLDAALRPAGGAGAGMDRNASKDGSRDASRNGSTGVSRDVPSDASMRECTDMPRDASLDSSPDGGASTAASRGSSANAPGDAFRDASQDTTRDASMEASMNVSTGGGFGASPPSTAGHPDGSTSVLAQASLVLATHNRASTSTVAAALLQAGHPPDQAGVHFAQILGGRPAP